MSKNYAYEKTNEYTLGFAHGYRACQQEYLKLYDEAYEQGKLVGMSICSHSASASAYLDVKKATLTKLKNQEK